MPLADHASLRIEALDRDVVRPRRPMHARTRAALGELQQPGSRMNSRVARSYPRARARSLDAHAGEHAELAAGDPAHDVDRPHRRSRIRGSRGT